MGDETKKTRKKNLRVILAGGGRLGLDTAHLLADRGHDLVIVDGDEERCERLSEEFVATVICGDATDPEILEQADPGRSDALAALTGDPEANRRICRSAREMNPELRTVVRSDEESREEEAGGGEEGVDEVIRPDRLGAVGAANAILGSSVRALENVTGRLQILSVRISEDAPVAGKRIEEVALPDGCLVVSAAEGDRIASADTVLEAGKSFIVAAEPGVADELQRLLRG